MKATLLLLCLLGSSLLHAQDTLFCYPLNADVPLALTLVSPEADKHVCLVLLQDDSVRYLLLDSNLHLITEFSRSNQTLTDFCMGEKTYGQRVFFRGDTIRYYFTVQMPKSPWALFCKTIDFAHETSEERAYTTFMSRDNTLGFVFSPDGAPFWVGMRPGKPQIFTDLLVSWSGSRRDTVDVSALPGADRIFGFVHYVPDDQPQQLDNLAERTVAFSRGRQLLFLSGERASDLFMSIFELGTPFCHFRALSTREGFEPADSNDDYNVASTLAEDRLFVVRCGLWATELNVYSVPMLDRLQHIVLDSAYVSGFAEGPLQLATGQPAKPVPLDKFRWNLRKGPAGIAVNRDTDGTWLVTIGTYQEGKKRYFDDGTPNYRDANRRSSAHNDMPAPITVDNIRDDLRLTFEAQVATLALDKGSLEVIHHRNTPAAVERMENTLPSPNPALGPLHPFRVGNKWYAGAFDQNRHTYNIWEIRP